MSRGHKVWLVLVISWRNKLDLKEGDSSTKTYLAGVCSAIISSATCEMRASQSGGGSGVVSFTTSLYTVNT